MIKVEEFEPAGFRLLVKPDTVETKVKQGEVEFYLAGDKKLEQAGQMVGTLVKVGKAAWPNETPWAFPGDRVYFFRYAGHEIELDGQKYRLMDDNDIIGVVTPQEGQIDG